MSLIAIPPTPEFPMQVFCEWIGNSRAVAMKHYLQVTDDHYAKAAKPTGSNNLDAGKSEALLNAPQHVAKPAGTGPQPEPPIVAPPSNDAVPTN